MKPERLWLRAAVFLLLFGPAFPQKQDTTQAPPPKSKPAQGKAETEKPRERVPTDLAGADRAYRGLVSLPCYPDLDEAERSQVVAWLAALARGVR